MKDDPSIAISRAPFFTGALSAPELVPESMWDEFMSDEPMCPASSDPEPQAARTVALAATSAATANFFDVFTLLLQYER